MARGSLFLQEIRKAFGNAVAAEHATAVGIDGLDSLHHAVYALAFLGANRNDGHVFEHRFALEEFLHHVIEGLVVLVREDVPLVQDDHESLTGLTDFRDNAVILDFHATGAIHHQHGHIGTADTFERAHVAERFHFVFDLGLFAEPGRIGHHELLPVHHEIAIDGVAGRSRNIGNHSAFLAHEAIQQSALAGIRAAKDGKADGAFFAAFAEHGRRQHGDDLVQKAQAGIARQRTDSAGLTKAEFEEFIAFLAVALVFTLVRDQDDLLVELADKAGELLVELGDAHADIHHEKHEVRFVHGIKNLLADTIRKDVDGIVRQESAGIHDDKLMALVVRILVMAVAGHTVAVAHHGGPAAKDAVKQGGLSYVRTSDNANYG